MLNLKNKLSYKGDLMIGKTEVGIVLLGIPVLYTIATKTNADFVEAIFVSILTAGGVALIAEGNEIEIEATQKLVYNKFDQFFDELEDIVWTSFTMNG